MWITVAKKMWKKLPVTDEEKQRFGKGKKSIIIKTVEERLQCVQIFKSEANVK